MESVSELSAKVFHRPMAPADIPECVKLIANDPVIGPRYGRMIEHLPAVWLDLVQREVNSTQVFFAEGSSNAPICFYGVTAVVRDNFLREIKSPPHCWIGPEIIKRVVDGRSPFLSDQELREANSNGGLNLVCWENCVRPGFESHSELQRCIMSSFIQIHQGYRWKELIANQAESIDRLDFLLATGAFLWDATAGEYTSKLSEDPADVISKPHILGITDESERNRQRAWAGRWVGALFDYHVPRLGLNRSEQRLLTCALGGATDERIAGLLSVSIPTVKKMWVSAYLRVEDHLPELLANALGPEIPSSGRGREKRRKLLSYLRDHPEELRPYSRKILAKSSGHNLLATMGR